MIKFIQPLCEQGKLDYALVFFMENYQPHSNGEMTYHSEAALGMILKSATEAKQFGLVETAIDRIVPMSCKAERIRSLLKLYFELDLREKLEALYLKHSDFLNSLIVDSINFNSIIEIHLLRGNIDKAWKITMELLETNCFITSCLLFFLQRYAPHHQQKITDLQKLVKEDIAKEDLEACIKS